MPQTIAHPRRPRARRDGSTAQLERLVVELRRLTLGSPMEWDAPDLTLTQLRALFVLQLRAPVSNPAPASPFHELSRGRVIVTTAGVILALLLTSLDQTIVGTAMPRVIAELNGLDYYAWVTTAYLVASTVMVPIAGKLGDLFGRKPFLLTGMVGFVVASALCGLSQNMT